MERQPYDNMNSSGNRKDRKSRPLVLLVPLLMLITVVFVLYFIVFRVNDIHIMLEFDAVNNPSGVQPLTEEQLRDALGIDGAPSYFTFDREAAEASLARFNSMPGQTVFLKLESFEKESFTHATVSVVQRQGIARIIGSEGNVCILDREGVMLENVRVKDSSEDVRPEMILLKDMILKEIPRKNGVQIKPVNAHQMEMYTRVISQMMSLDILYVKMGGNSVMLAYSEMSIPNAESVTFTTWDGYTVIIDLPEGESISEVRAKLRTMVIIMDEVRNDKSIHSTGVLRINKAGEATFTPE